MPLESGTELGPYQILGPLGAGGMGEVYRARDSRLSREVALKLLPEVFQLDRERAAKLTREAQLLASLNHPNIAAIYGVEESAGRLALVLECVEGETLAERIGKGPIPAEEALPIALQIAHALEWAHEKGVVHRDLKPANVKVTPEGVVKVLDFGLAKALGDGPAATSDLSHSPTMSIAATGAGIILGTAAYMAPEQALGKPVDQRADIWAFGVVLFEMLSGRRAFEGETVTDTLAKILEREPEWKRLPGGTPAALRKLLQRCLTKNPKNRLQAIGDARTLIQELIEDPEQAEFAGGAAYPLWKKILPWAVAPVLLAAGLFLGSAPSPPDRAVARFDVPVPDDQVLAHVYRHAVEVSPDGRRIAFVAAPPGALGIERRIYVRNLDQAENVPLPGTEGAQNPFFSPDGEWLGFQQGQQIRKVALAGGSSVVVVEDLNLPLGSDWGPPGIGWGRDGTIVYPNNLGSGLSIVRDTGGQPEVFTELDAANDEASHRLPHFLPDGSAVLFTVLRYAAIAPDWTRAQVWVKSLESGERKLLIENALDARYAGDGTLIFAREGRLYAVRFDPSTLSVSGTEVPVLDGVIHAVYGQAAVTWSGAAQYSVTDNGTLFYAPGSFEPPLLSSFLWVDRQGNVTPVTGMRPMFRFAARILADGQRISFSELYVDKDIWIFDTLRGTEERATHEGQNSFPIWAMGGSRLAFRSDRSGPLRIYLSEDVSSREVTELTPGPFDVPSTWTPDGRELIFTRGFSSLGGDTDIYAVSIDEPGNPRPILATTADERFPELSPDGRWLAYVSDETGRLELYVQPYPGPGRRVTVTSDGGQDPAWSKNSDELFYRNGASMMSVRFTATDTEFVPERPVMLFQQAALGAGTTVRATYDVSPDGRFLFNQPVPDAALARNRRIFPSTLRFVLNWTEEAGRLLAPR